MEDSKLVRILKTLDAKEFRRFKIHINSPNYNKNTNHIALLDFISKYYPLFDSPKFTEEEAYQKLYPNTIYKSDTITKLASRLFRLLVDFLSIESTINDSKIIEFNLLNEYANRNLISDFDRLSKKIEKQYAKQKTNQNTEQYYNIFLLERLKNKVISTRLDKGMGDAHFKDVGNALDLHYFYTKLIYACQVVNRSIVVKGIEIEDYNRNIIEIIPQTPYINHSVIDLWYTAYLMLSQQDKMSYYHSLKQKLYENPKLFAPLQQRNLFTYLENIAIRFIEPRTSMFEEVFELYNFQLDHDVFLSGEINIPGLIKNYMTVSLNLGKVDKATQFLAKIKNNVIEKYPENYRFCEAMLLFEKKEYLLALDVLNGFNFSNVIMKLNERIMRLKIYYHLEYFDTLDDTLNSFRVFLTYNKDILNDRILDTNRRFSSHLTKILKTLTDISPNYAELKESIEEDQQTVDKKWLLEQVALLV